MAWAKMFPPEAVAPAGGLLKGEPPLMAAEAKRPVGGVAAAAVGAAAVPPAEDPKMLVSGFGIFPKIFPVGAVLVAVDWNGLLTTDAAAVVVPAAAPPKTEDVLLVVDAVEVLAVKAAPAAAAGVAALPRLLKAFEKEKALPGTEVPVVGTVVATEAGAGGVATGAADALAVMAD